MLTNHDPVANLKSVFDGKARVTFILQIFWRITCKSQRAVLHLSQLSRT